MSGTTGNECNDVQNACESSEDRPLIDILRQVGEQCFTDERTNLYLRAQGVLIPVADVAAMPGEFSDQAEDPIWRWLRGPYSDLDSRAEDVPAYHTEGWVLNPRTICEVVSESVPEGDSAAAHCFMKQSRLAVEDERRLVLTNL